VISSDISYRPISYPLNVFPFLLMGKKQGVRKKKRKEEGERRGGQKGGTEEEDKRGRKKRGKEDGETRGRKKRKNHSIIYCINWTSLEKNNTLDLRRQLQASPPLVCSHSDGDLWTSPGHS
jgi:hypothetical protein